MNRAERRDVVLGTEEKDVTLKRQEQLQSLVEGQERFSTKIEEILLVLRGSLWERFVDIVPLIDTENRKKFHSWEDALAKKEQEKKSLLLDYCVEDGDLTQQIRDTLIILKEFRPRLLDVAMGEDTWDILGSINLFYMRSPFGSGVEQYDPAPSLGQVPNLKTLRVMVRRHPERSEEEDIQIEYALGLRKHIEGAIKELESLFDACAQKKEEQILGSSVLAS